jgi:hypothetical protein
LAAAEFPGVFDLGPRPHRQTLKRRHHTRHKLRGLLTTKPDLDHLLRAVLRLVHDLEGPQQLVAVQIAALLAGLVVDLGLDAEHGSDTGRERRGVNINS